MKPESHKFLASLVGAAFILVGAGQAAEIHDAAQAGDVVRIKALLATNATLANLAGEDELTPLHVAARQGKMQAAAVLLQNGADVNAKDVHGCRPLHSAVYGNHTAVAEFLLDHRANVDAGRLDGTTPLFYAAQIGNTNLVKLLLGRGAKPDAPSRSGYTPLHPAVQGGHLAVAEMLVAAGASVEAKDQEGHTPLHVAAKAGDLTIAEWLLNHGADADARDRLSFKPLDYVTGATNAALASLLEQHMKPRIAQSPSMKVGEAGDPDRIVFEDVQTFTGEQIHHALAIKPSYLLAAHPQASLVVFLDTLKGMVESGYQAAGFPDARVDVRYDEQASRVHVKVTEGSRFRSGKIRVMGARSVDVEDLVNWFTTPASMTPKAAESFKTMLAQKAGKNPGSVEKRNVSASASLTLNRRPGELNTPGKATRPDDPLWVPGEPADFSVAWATQAVAQVEACLAEQGFFFPKAKVELQRDSTAHSANLLITILKEGPPGVIGDINVTGTQRNTAADLMRFLNLREGTKITAERLATARKKLRDCGRFRDFEMTPEYTGLEEVSSHRVNLLIAVKEQDGVPRLNEPLSPVQQALLKLCEWVEQFPERDEDVQVTVTNQNGIPFALEFVLSPKRGLLLNSADLNGSSPFSAGFLLTPETVQLCAWASGSKLATARGTAGGSFFLHLLPDKSGGSNHFNFSVGAGFNENKQPDSAAAKAMLDFDVQLTPAAFFDILTRKGSSCHIDGGALMVTNGGFNLRAEAATGRLIRIDGGTNQPYWSVLFGGRILDRAAGDFMRHSAPLTNRYTSGRGWSSFLALATTEAARWWLTDSLTSNVTATQRTRALAAMSKLLNPEVFYPMDRLFGGDETNTFTVPMDEVDQAIGQNSVAAFFSGFAFEYGSELFPKYSWPWTISRETAFVVMNQGRYTDVELDRLYRSEDTGPVGCLVIANLLSAAGVPAAQTFASQGSMRLGADGFLRDCNLFLRGQSGLAHSFDRTAEALRNLPEEELAALVAILPGPEADLLRESGAALRARPDAAPATVLAPALGKYWEQSLRAKVRESLRQLTSPSKGKDQGTTGM